MMDFLGIDFVIEDVLKKVSELPFTVYMQHSFLIAAYCPNLDFTNRIAYNFA